MTDVHAIYLVCNLDPPSVQSDVITTVRAEFADTCLEFSDWLARLQLYYKRDLRPITEPEPFHS